MSNDEALRLAQKTKHVQPPHPAPLTPPDKHAWSRKKKKGERHSAPGGPTRVIIPQNHGYGRGLSTGTTGNNSGTKRQKNTRHLVLKSTLVRVSYVTAVSLQTIGGTVAPASTICLQLSIVCA